MGADMATIARRSALNPAMALVLLLGASVLLNYVDRGAIGVAAPLMKSDLGLTATAFGLAVSAFFWIYAPVQLVAWLAVRSILRLSAPGVRHGPVVDQHPSHGLRRRLRLAPRPAPVLGTRRKHRLSRQLQDHLPARSRGTARACERRRRRSARARPSGRHLRRRLDHGGVRLARDVRRFRTRQRNLADALVGCRAPTARRRRARASRSSLVRKIVGRWSLWSMGIVHACGNYGFYFVLAWLPLYLVQQRGLTIMQMTMLATLLYVVQAISALILGNWSDRWTRSGRSEASMSERNDGCQPAGLRGLHARNLRGPRHRNRRCAALRLRNVPRGGVGKSLRDRADVRRMPRVGHLGRRSEFRRQYFRHYRPGRRRASSSIALVMAGPSR